MRPQHRIPQRASRLGRLLRSVTLVAVAVVATSACGSPSSGGAPRESDSTAAGAKAAGEGPKTEIWRPIDSWSGDANAQLGTFWIESFDWRVRWEAAATSPDSYLKVVVHSGDSGRDLAFPVDTKGSGSGTGYVTELPRAFYLTVETKNTAWKLWVDESIGVKPVDRPDGEASTPKSSPKS